MSFGGVQGTRSLDAELIALACNENSGFGCFTFPRSFLQRNRAFICSHIFFLAASSIGLFKLGPNAFALGLPRS